MKNYTWEQQRGDIQRDVDKYFGRKMSIAPRAMAALQSGDNHEAFAFDEDEPYYGVYEISVLESLIKCSPGCATILFKAGAKLESFEFYGAEDEPAPLADGTLEWIFSGVHCDGITPTARRASKRRVLQETDLLISGLEAALRGEELNEFAGQLLKAAGIDEEYEAFGLSKPADTYLKKILKHVKQLSVADPAHAMLQWVLYEDEARQIRLRPFGVTDLSRITVAPPVKEEQEYIYRGGVFQPVETLIRDASADMLAEFEGLLNSAQASEADFQRFFEDNPFFLTGVDFARAHPQPILYMDEGSRLIPDFFLEKLASGWDTILDIKRPFDDMVMRRPHRTYFKQFVQNAIAQLRFYREWFESPANRAMFREAYGVTTFRPKMVIVIGRNHHFRDDIERIQLLEGLPSQMDLWTYDDVYARAKRYLSLTMGPKP